MTEAEQPAETSERGCPRGCASPPPGCVIKGNISQKTGERIYHLPGQRWYEKTIISPEDGERFSLADGERVRVTSRRGSLEVPVRIDPSLRPGLTFMTLHFQDDVATNVLTIDATDPKSGTAEFKATAIRIEKLEAPVPA